MFEKPLIHMCATTHSHEWHEPHKCVTRPHSYVLLYAWHDLLACVAQPTHMRDMTAFICVTWPLTTPKPCVLYMQRDSTCCIFKETAHCMLYIQRDSTQACCIWKRALHLVCCICKETAHKQLSPRSILTWQPLLSTCKNMYVYMYVDLYICMCTCM